MGDGLTRCAVSAVSDLDLLSDAANPSKVELHKSVDGEAPEYPTELTRYVISSLDGNYGNVLNFPNILPPGSINSSRDKDRLISLCHEFSMEQDLER
nr:hypothetical protein CFP56_02619 [Quercus suber]